MLTTVLMSNKLDALPGHSVSLSKMPPSQKLARSSVFTLAQGIYVTPRSTSQYCLYSGFIPLFNAQAIYKKEEI